MFEAGPPTLTPLKVAYGVAFFALCMLGNAGGPAIHIDSRFYHAGWLLGIPVGLVMAWYFHLVLLGRLYKSKTGGMRPLGMRDSWIIGSIAAGVLVMVLPFPVATIVNRVIGTTYTDPYLVIGKSVEHRKRTCYDLTLVKANNASDRFDVCVPKEEQDATRIGAQVQVTGRRSRYVNQMIRFSRVP